MQLRRLLHCAARLLPRLLSRSSPCAIALVSQLLPPLHQNHCGCVQPPAAAVLGEFPCSANFREDQKDPSTKPTDRFLIRGCISGFGKKPPPEGGSTLPPRATLIFCVDVVPAPRYVRPLPHEVAGGNNAHIHVSMLHGVFCVHV